MPKSKKPAPTPSADVAQAVPPEPGGEPAILQRLDAPAKWSWALVAGGVVLAAGLSLFAVRGAMKRGSKSEG